MRRFWMTHWRYKGWRREVNLEKTGVVCAGGNLFRQRGVKRGDVVYIVSMKAGQVYLGARMPVKQIVGRAEAVSISGDADLFPAVEWVIDRKRTGTPLQFDRRLAPALTRRIEVVTPRGDTRGLFFVSPEKLGAQATRGVHQLTWHSAQLLDEIITATEDELVDEPLTVTLGMVTSPTDRAFELIGKARRRSRSRAAPRVFVSYSHDSEDHKHWVRNLAGTLRRRGIDALLDQWDLKPGMNIALFSQLIAAADRVVVVCTPRYVRKADKRVPSGVLHEIKVIKRELRSDPYTRKIIPILRQQGKHPLPQCLGDRFLIDFTRNDRFSDALEDLVRELRGVARFNSPPVGRRHAPTSRE